ncbi:MAG: hypothetical protein ABSF83_08980 [Nitrososphaerales archaeon]
MARASSSSLGRLLLRGQTWLRNARHYLLLVLLDLLFFSGWSVLTGIAPAGDIRAHIFRTLEFAPGLLGGDYTSIQYHGYAFLAGYGVGFYTLTWSIYSVLAVFVAGFQAATIACNAMWVLTPLVLAFSAVALADELGMSGSRHRRPMQAMLGATILLFPGVVGASLSGADPYMLSFAFSLFALTFGLRSKDGGTALLGLLAFSALSIYMESFGYFFVGTVFLGLLATRRPVLKVLPLLAAVTAFSWVQLSEVSSYMSPYIEEVPVLGVSFLTIFGVTILAVCAYSLAFFLLRGRLGESHRALFIVVVVTVLAAGAAVARGSFGLDLGALNALVDNVLPWRLVFVNLPVLLIVSVYVWSEDEVRLPGFRKALGVASVILISAPIFLGTYPIAFGPMPSAGQYESFSGNRLLVTGPALLVPSSPVTYSPAFDYSTVSGAFGQGDPSFFSITAYYEWSDSLVPNSVVADNLMHITGANEMVANFTTAPAHGDSSNSTIECSCSQAEAVTPILLEASNSTEALEFALFVNLLGKDGFMLDFVTSPAAIETFGAIVLPGYRGTTPAGLPTYSVQNDSFEASGLGAPLAEPFLTPSLELDVPATNASIDAASSMADSLISFFHPAYDPLTLGAGEGYYSVSSNSSLPIQIAVSYYPYFEPANYSQNVYHFMLLPGPERIYWHLPYFEAAATVSLVAALACALFGRSFVEKSRSARPVPGA